MVRQGRRGRVLLLDPPRRRTHLAPVWPLGQVLAAALNLDALVESGKLGREQVPEPTTEELFTALERYRVDDGYGPHPGERPVYFDDNAWIGLDFVQCHLQAGRDDALAAARRVMAVVLSGEHPTGGVRWVDRPGSPRNTCATAPAMQLALRLHALEPDSVLFEFAQRCSVFLRDRLLAPSGLLWDHIEADGTVERTYWTYNQGTSVSAWALLAATGDRGAAQLARATLEATLVHFGPGESDALWRQPPIFNAVMFRNLLAAAAILPDPDLMKGVREVATGYADRVWREARDPLTGLLDQGGIGTYEGSCIDQAGMVQLLAVLALPEELLIEVC
ncbi:MAG: glycoside hydrolase family 76 protein [Acidimicrobiales bacterium]|nr:glycoside hydrolase family 76 protein [Acidimicrobiales bacterium]